MDIHSLNVLIEALKAGNPVNKVFISDSRKDKKIGTVLDLCRKKGVTFQMVPQETIYRKAGPDNQGVFAEMSPVKFLTLENVLANAGSGLILILDGINDTGNMGAIIRSAVAADVDAIIVSQRNSAPINETVLKTSAGSLVKARLVQSKNLVNTVKTLKENGFWIVGTEMSGPMVYHQYDFKYKTAVVLGNEHKGVSQLLKKNADYLLSISYPGNVESLNVSVSAAIILFEALRQKAEKKI